MRSLLNISLFVACMLVYTANTYAQQTIALEQDNSPTNVFFLVPHYNPLFGLGYVNPAKSIIEVADGSQFYNEEFKKIVTPDSGNNLKARYNAFLDEMEIQRGDTFGWINKAIHQGKIIFSEDDISYKILDADKKPEIKALGYFEVVSENKALSLYKRKAKKLAVGLERMQYMIPAPEIITEFQPLKTEFFVEFWNNGEAVKLPRTRRGVARVFGDKKDQVLSYIKENKLKVTKEEDIKKVIAYVNTL
jgi:hypothetical protein